MAAAATAKAPGRCRGKGICPRIGSSAGSTSVAAVCAGTGEAGSRGAPKSGGLVVFGLGQSRPRSGEPAPVEAVLSFDRGASGSLGADGAGAAAELPVVDISPVAVAVAVNADEGACIAGK